MKLLRDVENHAKTIADVLGVLKIKQTSSLASILNLNPTIGAPHKAAAVETVRDENESVSTPPNSNENVAAAEGRPHPALQRLSMSMLVRREGDGEV
jgi:hypothetical protein